MFRPLGLKLLYRLLPKEQLPQVQELLLQSRKQQQVLLKRLQKLHRRQRGTDPMPGYKLKPCSLPKDSEQYTELFVQSLLPDGYRVRRHDDEGRWRAWYRLENGAWRSISRSFLIRPHAEAVSILLARCCAQVRGLGVPAHLQVRDA